MLRFFRGQAVNLPRFAVGAVITPVALRTLSTSVHRRTAVLPTLRPVLRSSSVRLMSSSPTSSVTPEKIIEVTTAAPSSEIIGPSLSDTGVKTVADVVAGHSGLHLDTPVYVVIDLLNKLNELTGMSWFFTIAAATLLVRVAILPIAIAHIRHSGNMQKYQPRMAELQALLNTYPKGTDKWNQTATELQGVIRQMNPLKMFRFPLVQMPVFISFFLGLRKLAESDIPALHTGGHLWFTDLAATDPTYILPILTGVTMLAIVEVGADGMPNPETKSIVRNIMRGASVVMVWFSAGLPQAVLAYWITNNTFSLLQTAVLKIPTIRDRLGIPAPKAPNPNAKPAPNPFAAAWKDISKALDDNKNKSASSAEFKASDDLPKTTTDNLLKNYKPPVKAPSGTTTYAQRPKKTDKKFPQ